MKLKIFTDISIMDQESVTIQLDKDGNLAEGISLMIAKPGHGADEVEVLLPKAELEKALAELGESEVGDRIDTLRSEVAQLNEEKNQWEGNYIESQKILGDLVRTMTDALDHLDRGNDINAMGLLRKTLREL